MGESTNTFEFMKDQELVREARDGERRALEILLIQAAGIFCGLNSSIYFQLILYLHEHCNIFLTLT